MRLKQLEIKGFKSFASQTVVNFDADVIGIVGPNGSGKSNIVDAIRWVLGEQKGSELRLDKMASVIFNGTRKKKAGNLASVSLTFVNDKELLPTDYNEVTITRMLYRSGDSEYRLNGVSCRLKDIRNLFLDTGIGSNSYAIIALGMVDDILADKDNSRRRMFEQAAGISKYKNRKKETLRKLKNTEDDLDRIEDLLHEIDGNLKSLEKQAKRARKYLDIKQQYRGLSMLLTGIRLEKLRIDQRKAQDAIQQAEERYRGIDARLADLEGRLTELREANAEREQLVGERQRKLNALVGELRSVQNEQQLLQQRRTFVDRQREKLALDNTAADQQLVELDAQTASIGERLGEARTETAHRSAARAEAEAALAAVKERHGGLKQQLDGGLREQQDQERQIFDLEKRRAINGNQVENYRFQIERNVAEMDERRTEYTGLEEQLTVLNQQEESGLREVSELEKREAERREAVTVAETNVEHLRTELDRINRGLDARRNEHTLTKSMIDSLEGFPESIRFLSKNKQWTKAPQLLSDLLLVEPDYRAALENYLEPYLNYYVVDTLAEARAGIALLGQQRKGRANFFLLDRLPTAPEHRVGADGKYRPAREVVTVEAPYAGLADWLLREVYLARESTVPADLREDITVIDGAGGYIARPHSVSGGSVGLFEGKKIGRKKNLEVLASAIAEAETKAAELGDRYRAEKQQLAELKSARLDQQVQQRQRALSQLQQRRASLHAKVEGFTSFFTRTEEKNTELGERSRELLLLNERIDTDLAQLRDRIGQLRENVATTDDAYRQLSEELSTVSNRYNEEHVRYIQQQNLLQTLQRELEIKDNRRTELAHQRTSNETQLQSLEQEATRFGQQDEQFTKNLAVMTADRVAYQANLSEAERAYVTARATVGSLEDEIRRDGRQRQDAQVNVNQLRERLTEVRFKLEALAERLRIEFNMSLEELTATEVEEWTGTVGELELKVERLRGRIGNYGEINPLAVEAYDEMKVRHETITAQRDDIVSAKETLVKTIREIEETATVQFLEAFDRVRIFFIDVFRSLFTEDDNCDLILLDPEHPLESGIEVVAKPKGKRPQTISQLSGGEKTLTATALLFALYLLKPAPFCIFDEVDAPLDDANISKFNRIIKKFSRDSQFIIVTHNKLTMEAVDSIYGVYTTEQGGSGVLPVQFTELEGSTTFSAA